ncbi:MAG: LysE family translocator [Sphingomonadaceae bacterium]
MTLGDPLLPMAAFAFATSATPGPVNILSAMSGARFGIISSLPYVLGATASFVAMLLLIGFGFRSFIELIEAFSRPIALIGAAYLLYLAYKIAADRGDLNFDGSKAIRPSFITGALTQAVNPKAWIVSLSAISLYVGPYTDHVFRLTAFSAIFFAICATSLAGWVVVGSYFARFSGNVALFNRAMAVLLVASVIPMVI